jgi:hypothetical protein
MMSKVCMGSAFSLGAGGGQSLGCFTWNIKESQKAPLDPALAA